MSAELNKNSKLYHGRIFCKFELWSLNTTHEKLKCKQYTVGSPSRLLSVPPPWLWIKPRSLQGGLLTSETTIMSATALLTQYLPIFLAAVGSKSFTGLNSKIKKCFPYGSTIPFCSQPKNTTITTTVAIKIFWITLKVT